MHDLHAGLTARREEMVTEANAISFLDGGPRVLATPVMIMLMEMTSRDLAKSHLEDGYDTVGTHVDVKHLAATPIGMKVTFSSELLEVGDRKLRFRVEAWDAREKVGEGFHERAIINVSKFGDRVRAKAAG